MAIRTFEFGAGHVWLGSGGGITASSDADAEYRECLLKAVPLIRALDARLGEEPAAAGAGPSRRRCGRGRRRECSPRCASAAAAATTSTGISPAWRTAPGGCSASTCRAGLDADLAACLAGQPSGRLRLTVRPAGGPLRVTVEVVPAGPAASAVALRPVTIRGGLGAHKWLDRRLLAMLSDQAGLGPDEHLLIQDGNGDVLETDRASIFAVIDGVVHTPPADGRLLPGVTRAAVLRLARDEGLTVRQEPLSGRQLLAASEVFVTNSVYGVLLGPVAGRRGRQVGSRTGHRPPAGRPCPQAVWPRPRGGPAGVPWLAGISPARLGEP